MKDRSLTSLIHQWLFPNQGSETTYEFQIVEGGTRLLNSIRTLIEPNVSLAANDQRYF